MRPSGGRRAALAATLFAAAGGCGLAEGGPADPSPCRAPEILSSAVSANPDNVLSAVVTARVRLADSVALRFGPAGTALDSVTPTVVVVGDSVLVPALGLLPDTPYTLQLVAYPECGTLIGATLGFMTGRLPPDLPSYTASGSDPSPGYVVIAAGMYGLVIDNTGRVVWYHRFPNGPGLNFQAQPTGRYVARPSPSVPTEPTLWVELDPLGSVTRTFGCARGLQPRFHDLLAEPNGSYWVMCDEARMLDLSSLGGVVNAQVLGTVIQHISESGTLLFEWDPFDHFAIEDLDPAERTGANVNWTHGNALDLDSDGNLLVSFRSLSEITKIDARTGAVRWRMGGRANQFTFQDTAEPAFLRQHGLRVSGGARFTLLDNLGEPGGSRAERYEYDEAQRTVRLTGLYGTGAGVTALVGGTTQTWSAGRVLVSFGSGGRVAEYDAAGNLMWRIEGSSGYVFRAQRIRSLYHPGVDSPR